MDPQSHAQAFFAQTDDESAIGMTTYLIVTFKYGGDWVIIKNQSRQKYVGGRQKSIKFDRLNISLSLLRDKVEEICSWERGCTFDLYLHKPGSSPKEYQLLSYDDPDREVDFLLQSLTVPRAEIVVIVPHNYTDYGDEQRSSEASTSCPQPTPGSSETLISNQLEVAADDKFLVGTQFSDAQSFKQALRNEAMRKNFGFKITTSDRTRVLVACIHSGCAWRIRATLCHDGQTFEVRKVGGAHTCPGVNRAGNKQATTGWIAGEIADLIKQQPSMPPKEISHRLETSYGLYLPYMQLWRSRELARSSVYGSVDDNYKYVPQLHAELVKRNPGSRITYETDMPGNSFKRFFISFKVCVEGFLSGCRYLIGLDACHLKSKYLGVLLSATSLDGNNGLYNLAFAIVESESKNTWKWFLDNLMNSIGFELYPLAIISDMEKGLLEAVRTVFPNAEHRVCLRHMWKNLVRQFKCQEGNKLHSSILICLWRVQQASFEAFPAAS